MSSTDSPHSSTTAQGEAGELPALRRRLLAGVLRHAPFDGWSDKALAAAARDEGITAELAAVAFQGGPAEVAEFFNTEADAQMVAALEAAFAEAAVADVVAEATTASVTATGSAMPTGNSATAAAGGLKIRDRIALAVRTRLLQHAAHREALRALASFLALPTNAGLAARCLWRTVDAMWRAVGDTATDFNYYSKRTLLAGVYGSTVLVWLDDSSEGFADTFAFLDRRIADVMTIERYKSRLRRSLDGLFTRVDAVFGRSGPTESRPGPFPFPPKGYPRP